MNYLKYKIKILILLIFSITFLFFMAGCSEKMVRYDDFTFMVAFEFPSNWEAVCNNYLINGKPTRFEGGSGFVQIAALNGGDRDIGEIASEEAMNESNSYGSKPQIEKTDIRSREAYFIMPSSDQPEEFNNKACLIIEYPYRIIIDDSECRYFILWADLKHIRKIANSLYFISY